MKKYVILLLVGVFSLFSTAVFTQSVFAQADSSASNPGILPTSPFYFLKEWKRGVVRTFTFNSEKKAELELDEANERAAEIKKLEEISPEKTEALAKAAENYQENVERLKVRLEALKETSKNPNMEKLIEKVVDRSIEHQELFIGLQEKLADKEEVREQLKASGEKIGEIISNIPEQLKNSETIKEKLELKELNQVKELNQIKGLNEIASSSGITAPSAVPSVFKEESVQQENPAILSPLKNINAYLQEKKEQIEERKKEQNCVEIANTPSSSKGGCLPVIDLPVVTSTVPLSASSTPSIIASSTPSLATSTTQN